MPSPPGVEPLLRLYPALAKLRRVALGQFPSPVQRIEHPSLRGELWVKRDDLNAVAFGGNKVRALEWLLGDVGAGDTVLTVGGDGSTHVLATAEHAAALGAHTHALRWKHDMHPTAHSVARRTAERATIESHRSAVTVIARALMLRQRGTARWIPLGGTSPLGLLGHVNAALELADQIAAGAMPTPSAVVVPVGTGGTAAGLALGLRIAGLDTVVVGARVGPRIGSNGWRVRWLVRQTATLIERLTATRVPRPRRNAVRIVHDVYGGAYGRPLAAAAEGIALARSTIGLDLDETYSAKAFVTALALARSDEPVTLFWATFDARWMEERQTTDVKC